MSYQATNLTNVSVSIIPALLSNIDVCSSPKKSEDTTSSSTYSTIPFNSPSAAFFIAAQISSYVVGLSKLHVKSTTDTSIVGTLNAIPVNFPFNAGITFPTALAAPVDDGIMFALAARPPLQSFLEAPSTVFCVAVVL